MAPAIGFLASFQTIQRQLVVRAEVPLDFLYLVLLTNVLFCSLGKVYLVFYKLHHFFLNLIKFLSIDSILNVASLIAVNDARQHF